MESLAASPTLEHALAAAGVALEVHPCAALESRLLDELHAMANAMSAESRAHFETHARTNDVVHLFRSDVGSIVGFQFWRKAAGPSDGQRLVIGGKLRILPSFRRRSLNLISGLTYYREQLEQHPDARHYRVSLANLFGYVSLVRPLASYALVSEAALASEDRWLCDFVAQLASESHFALDRATGRVDVKIFVSQAQLDRYPAAFYHTREAEEYIAHNPGFRTDGTYLALWFALSPNNLRGIERAIESRLNPNSRR